VRSAIKLLFTSTYFKLQLTLKTSTKYTPEDFYSKTTGARLKLMILVATIYRHKIRVTPPFNSGQNIMHLSGRSCLPLHNNLALAATLGRTTLCIRAHHSQTTTAALSTENFASECPRVCGGICKRLACNFTMTVPPPGNASYNAG
jgi:hypothetical protein